MNWTVSSLLDWTTLYFRKYNIDNPHLEAEILLAFTLSLKRIDLYVQYERVLKDEELASFKEKMLRRVKHEPLAYITGSRQFMSLDLFVTKDTLIPRPETEHVVEVAIDVVKSLEKGHVNILDLCTGCGAVAVSIAQYAKNTRITASDISKEALAVAGKNSEKFGLSNRITLIESDMFNNIPAGTAFDIITVNPPYIPTKVIAALQPEVKDFEPVKALDGGTDGLDYYRILFEKAHGFLSPDGTVVTEIGSGQAKDIIEIINKSGRFVIMRKMNDHAGIERVIAAKRR